AEGDALTPGDLGSRRVCPSILKTAMTLPSLLAWWYQVWRADALSGLRWALAGYLVNFRRAVLIYLNVALTKPKSPYEPHKIRRPRPQAAARACRSSSL